MAFGNIKTDAGKGNGSASINMSVGKSVRAAAASSSLETDDMFTAGSRLLSSGKQPIDR